ncbi:HU family DNA-binding protein [Sphingomonas sp. AP4-R1]|jgi:DNA-binding protein HU-beta|uniref:HU family DNA-binding protein n=1 Tax=Sphingomonas sp. AP4-R1 TaxID=2735134 RepID=UPI00149365A1|nr:HU family DNA-binding protein [Sphingomonas sp. AP4-R1]QJU58986.1 HU family DNA-binding protein [Sphingomonas sp. AP4-R1]
MNKQELIVAVSEETGFNRGDTGRVVEAMLSKIGQTLVGGSEVRLVGFGTFSVTHRKPSTGRNPRTGEPMDIASTSQPKFRAGKVLKELVN